MKRFTATEKWDKAWFRALPLKCKSLWSYICDKCDCAGVWEPDFDLASFQIGAEVTESDLAVFGKRVVQLPCGKLFLTGFIPFQYGELTTDCRAHRPILKLVAKYNLIELIHPRIPIAMGIPMGIDTHKVQVQEQVQVQDHQNRGSGGKGKPDLTGAAAECDRLFARYSKLPEEPGRYNRTWFDLLQQRFTPEDVEVYLRWVIHENRTREDPKYRTRFHVTKMFGDLERFAADLSLAKAWDRNKTPRPAFGGAPPAARTAAEVLDKIPQLKPRPTK